MNLRMAALLMVCPLLGGCMSSVRVYRSDSLSARPRGIPFYVKTSVCRQETVWVEPQYVLTFTSNAGGSSYGPVEKILSREEYLSAAVQHFIAAPNRNEWNAVIVSLPGPDVVNENNAAAVESEQRRGNWIEAANTGTVEAVVDYEHVFYLNSGRPLTGTTQVNAKLGPDGTLAEASAEVQEQTLSTIASTIGSVAGAVTSTVLAGVAIPHVTGGESHLTIATKMYQHTHIAYSGPPARAETCAAAPQGVFHGSFAVADVTNAAAEKPAAEKANTIRVSGAIQLPAGGASTPK